jgi:hypothetical protein
MTSALRSRSILIVLTFGETISLDEHDALPNDLRALALSEKSEKKDFLQAIYFTYLNFYNPSILVA